MAGDFDGLADEIPLDDLPPPPRRTPAAKPPIGPPKEMAGYELGDEICRGGMGVVIRDPRLDRPVALKIVLSGTYSDR